MKAIDCGKYATSAETSFFFCRNNCITHQNADKIMALKCNVGK
jgi:hypothetical protein